MRIALGAPMLYLALYLVISVTIFYSSGIGNYGLLAAASPVSAASGATTVSVKQPAEQRELLTALNMSVISWNMAELAPTEGECAFLRAYQNQDIVVFGIQECEDIRPRRSEGHRSRKWRDIHAQMLGKKGFKCIARHKMGGLLIAVFVKKSLVRK